MTDLLIIGGGAAGLMAAGAACARGLNTAVVEHNPKGPGQKLLITGKGRCNVTNDCDVREFLNYVRHNPRFLYSALYAFSPASAMELFESLGVPLKTERGRRVFPQSDRAADVLAVAGILLTLPFAARPLRFLMGNRVMGWLAAVSMNYYLLHQNLAVHLKRLGVPPSVSAEPNRAGEQPWQLQYTLLCFGLSLLGAALITLLIEKPCAKVLKKTFARGKTENKA